MKMKAVENYFEFQRSDIEQMLSDCKIEFETQKTDFGFTVLVAEKERDLALDCCDFIETEQIRSGKYDREIAKLSDRYNFTRNKK